MSYIHEFPHPRLVVHFHPDPDDGGAFTADQVARALKLDVHAIELDLRFRSDDGAVACDHNQARPTSPTLAEIFDLVLVRKGAAATVNDDGRQFFLVLEPKESRTDLFEGLFATLRRYESVLSTAVRQGDPPRAITVVLTGAFRWRCHGYLVARHRAEVDRLFITEDVDYSGVVGDLSGRQDPATFAWTAIPFDRDRGRVNALHRGRDTTLAGTFNVRVWDTKDAEALRLAVASGADSVNCNLSMIAAFERILLRQEPRGLNPFLTVRAGRALLTWQGASGAGELYVAMGRFDASGLSFPRQISLTQFIAGNPRSVAPTAAWLPRGRLLIVYEGGQGSSGGKRLWYVSGRFLRPDRFLTFSGRQRLLTSDDGVWMGTFPSVAVGPDGRVIIVYAGTDAERLWYFSGFLAPAGELIGTEYELTVGDARRGSRPAIAIDRKGRVIVVYEGADQPRLWYVSGTINPQGRIDGIEQELTQGESRRGFTPSVGFDDTGRVVVIYEGRGDHKLWYVSGRLRDGMIEGPEFSLSEGPARRGSRPTVAFDRSGDVVVLYRGTDGAKLWYVRGVVDAAGQIVGQEQLLDISLDRR